MAAFAVFCALSGAVYLFNDVADREADQRHPLKRERPIASGQLSVPAAVTTGALLGAGGVAAAFSIGTMFGIVAATYLASLLLYSVALKHVVIVDVLMIAGGFVLRAVGGGGGGEGAYRTLAAGLHDAPGIVSCAEQAAPRAAAAGGWRDRSPANSRGVLAVSARSDDWSRDPHPP
jgi:4-hydroxybenzoate polyprenyltransferase